MAELPPIRFGRPYPRMMLGIVIFGAVVQLLLGMYFLGVGHQPMPRDLPVGLVVPADRASAVIHQLEADGAFDVTVFGSQDSLRRAVRDRTVDGGLVVTASGVQAVTASAAGGPPAATLRATASSINVDQGAAQSLPDDVVPLPAQDANGASTGFLLQVLSLGGALASLGLGRLVPRAPRSLRRGLGHAGALVAYGIASAGIALVVCSLYGVGAGANTGRLFVDFVVVSLAFTASTAGLVALIGPAGSLAGVVYFLIGSTISGASIPWHFLPSFWAAIGEWLPTGGGALVIRDTLYFPDATAGSGYVCLGLYAGLGLLAVLVTNSLGNTQDRDSVASIDVVRPVIGGHRGA